jgi:hypothetical protein
LSRARFGQLAPADAPAALADCGKIFTHLFLSFCRTAPNDSRRSACPTIHSSIHPS